MLLMWSLSRHSCHLPNRFRGGPTLFCTTPTSAQPGAIRIEASDATGWKPGELAIVQNQEARCVKRSWKFDLRITFEPQLQLPCWDCSQNTPSRKTHRDAEWYENHHRRDPDWVKGDSGLMATPLMTDAKR